MNWDLIIWLVLIVLASFITGIRVEEFASKKNWWKPLAFAIIAIGWCVKLYLSVNG